MSQISVRPVLKTTLVIPPHPSNECAPITVIELGIEMPVREVQPLNIPSGTAVIPLLNVKDVKPVHPLNKLVPALVTVFGNTTLVRLSQPSNAFTPIVVI